jgi:hypothetical protein
VSEHSPPKYQRRNKKESVLEHVNRGMGQCGKRTWLAAPQAILAVRFRTMVAGSFHFLYDLIGSVWTILAPASSPCKETDAASQSRALDGQKNDGSETEPSSFQHAMRRRDCLSRDRPWPIHESKDR